MDELTLAQIKALDAGDGAEVPSLAEYLEAIRDTIDAEAAADQRREFARLFLNPRPSNIASGPLQDIYDVAMHGDFSGLQGRYTWQFFLQNFTAGAENLRAIDATAPIGTFFGGFRSTAEVADILGLAASVDASTILAFPQDYHALPQVMPLIEAAGYEVGLSRTESQRRIVLPVALQDRHVSLIFTPHSEQLTYWNDDAPLAPTLAGHSTFPRGRPSHVIAL